VFDNVEETYAKLVLGKSNALTGPENNIAVSDLTEPCAGHRVFTIFWFLGHFKEPKKTAAICVFTAVELACRITDNKQ